jgi:hypothetical protein
MTENEMAELDRLRTEVRILMEANRFYREFIAGIGAMACSAVALPADLAEQGEEYLPPVLVDLRAAQDGHFESTGGC